VKWHIPPTFHTETNNSKTVLLTSTGRQNHGLRKDEFRFEWGFPAPLLSCMLQVDDEVPS